MKTKQTVEKITIKPGTVEKITIKPGVRERWIKALRSGNYPESTDGGYLFSTSGFSSLGVLCDLYLKDQGREWLAPSEVPGLLVLLGDKNPAKDFREMHKNTFFCDGFNQLLSEGVKRWAGLASSWPFLKINNKIEYLTVSIAGKSFKEIADLIEEQF